MPGERYAVRSTLQSVTPTGGWFVEHGVLSGYTRYTMVPYVEVPPVGGGVTFTSPGGPVVRRSGSTVIKNTGTTITLTSLEYSGGRYGRSPSTVSYSSGYIRGLFNVASKTGKAARAARALLRKLGLLGRTFNLLALGELLYGAAGGEYVQTLFDNGLTRAPPIGANRELDCGQNYPVGGFNRQFSGCFAVTSALTPPTTDVAPGTGAFIHEWGRIPQPDFFQWVVQAQWRPAAGGPFDVRVAPAVAVASAVSVLPESTPMTSSRSGPAPFPKWDVDGRLVAAPYVRSSVDMEFPPVGPRPPVRQGEHWDVPDGAKKARRVPRAMVAVLKLFHSATELCDAFGALASALPDVSVRGSALGSGIGPGQGCSGNIVYVLGNLPAFLDPRVADAAIEALIANEIEDRIMGALLSARWDNGVRIFNSSYGVGEVVGPVPPQPRVGVHRYMRSA